MADLFSEDSRSVAAEHILKMVVHGADREDPVDE